MIGSRMESALSEGLYTPKQSVIHDLDPRTKLVLILMVTIICVFIQNIIWLLLLALAVFVCVVISKTLEKAAWLLGLFSLFWGVAIILTFAVTGDINYSLSYFSTFFARFFAIICTGLLFAFTTSPNDLAKALEKLRIPSSITFTLTIALRYIPTLFREVRAILDALKLRGVRLRGRDLIQNPNYFYRGVIIPLIIRTIKMSDEIAAAAESRGFGSPYERTSLRQIRFHKGDYVFVYTMICLCGSLLLLDRIYPYTELISVLLSALKMGGI